MAVNPEGVSAECLVAVRPDVLNDAEHAVGNFLQRLHHMTRLLGAADAQQADRLRLALGDLERLLELLFDYVLPAEVAVRPTDAVAVADSLVSQVRAQTAGAVTASECPLVRLLVDPKSLSRCFQLLGVACGKAWQGGGLRVETVLEPGGERLRLVVSGAALGDARAAAEERMAAAVAAQLIEMQGGELSWSDRAPAALALTLPVQGGGDEAV
jgi:hypothetical protein